VLHLAIDGWAVARLFRGDLLAGALTTDRDPLGDLVTHAGRARRFGAVLIDTTLDARQHVGIAHLPKSSALVDQRQPVDTVAKDASIVRASQDVAVAAQRIVRAAVAVDFTFGALLLAGWLGEVAPPSPPSGGDQHLRGCGAHVKQQLAGRIQPLTGPVTSTRADQLREGLLQRIMLIGELISSAKVGVEIAHNTHM
jgi:hypothetical protein